MLHSECRIPFLVDHESYFHNYLQQNGFVPIEDDEGSGDEDDDGGLSVGAIVGIVLGALVGVGIIFIICRKFCFKSSKETGNASANVYETTNDAFDDPRDDLDGGSNDTNDNDAGNASEQNNFINCFPDSI